MNASASTPKGERRRQALVEAAAQLLVEGGFDAVRHRAVAERAGLPLASTTYYFRDLDDLVAAALEHHGRTELERTRARLEAMPPGRCTLRVAAELVLDLLLGAPREGTSSDVEAVVTRYERLVVTGRRPHLRPLSRELGLQLYALIQQILARAGLDLDDEQIRRIVALVDGTVVNALVEVDPDPRGAARGVLWAELARQVPDGATELGG
ncbi:MAG TPA: TetR family transcriptional regulator [Pseudonocardiaceae bacterium]